MSTNKKQPRAFKAGTSRANEKAALTEGRVYTAGNLSASDAAHRSHAGFTVQPENFSGSLKQQYLDVLRKIGLLTDIAVKGYERALLHASDGERTWADNAIKKGNTAKTAELLQEKRMYLAKLLHA